MLPAEAPARTIKVGCLGLAELESVPEVAVLAVLLTTAVFSALAVFTSAVSAVGAIGATLLASLTRVVSCAMFAVTTFAVTTFAVTTVAVVLAAGASGTLFGNAVTGGAVLAVSAVSAVFVLLRIEHNGGGLGRKSSDQHGNTSESHIEIVCLFNY